MADRRANRGAAEVTSMQVDAGAVYNAALALVTEQAEKPPPARLPPETLQRVDALARLAAYGLRHVPTVWVNLSLDDFLLIESHLPVSERAQP